MSSSELAAGRFDPVPTQSRVNVTAQLDDHHFVSPSRYDNVGIYNVTLQGNPNIQGALDVFWTGTAFTPGHILTLQPGFSNGRATVGVRIEDTAGTPVEDSFFLYAAYRISASPP
jgi:hypothetical protein